MLRPTACLFPAAAAGRSRLMRWVLRVGILAVRTENQCAVSLVRSAPLSGTPFARMTSYALMRSVATNRIVEASTAYNSRTVSAC